MKRSVTLTFLALMLSLYGFSQDPIEIIQKSEDLMRGKSSESSITIEIVRPKWTRQMTLKNWSLGTEYALSLVQSPAKEKGTVILKRDKEVWNWLPSIERSIKLPPSMMMQSWMGTDFTNDDLVKQSSLVTDYTHKILGDSTIDGRTCWKIQLTPKEDAAVVWGKIYTWIDKELFIQMRSELYDEDEFLVNIFVSSNVQDMGGKKIPTRLEMIPVEKDGHKTVLIYNDLQFDVDVQESFFTPQNMRRIR
jgi:outer membrane lipoprotein-sorting protein